MNRDSSGIRLSATDLSHHLACPHVTTLDLQVAQGAIAAPKFLSPDAQTLRELGERHEAAYLAHLERDQKLTIVNLKHIADPAHRIAETLAEMQKGTDVIAQGALATGNWIGYPDVLRRVPAPTKAWPWSYEVADTKLTMETKGGTILQLLLYSLLLENAQQHQPENLWVIPPGNNFSGESYRIAEYEAYFRQVKKRLEQIVAAAESGNAVAATYPEPVDHCAVCRWFQHCDKQRRADDHLSLVAGIHRQQRVQLEAWNTRTVAELAQLPIPIRQQPAHGTRVAIAKVREQARVQMRTRDEGKLAHECLPLVADTGFCRLPDPSPHDIFLDFEGDPFVAPSGLQYLTGFAYGSSPGALHYESRWALDAGTEKAAFEWLLDEIMRRRESDSFMHIYHFGAYEPATIKRLTGLHATRADEVDRLLRGGAFVDLHQAFKQAILAGVEEYSLKKLEAFCGFVRAVPLDQSGPARRLLEHTLQLSRDTSEIAADTFAKIEGYNRDDCLAAADLRDWLEAQRAALQKRTGIGIARFINGKEEPKPALKAREKRIHELEQALREPIEKIKADDRTATQKAQWLLADLLDWHRREDRRKWQEYFELAALEESELLESRSALTGMVFQKRITEPKGKNVAVDLYSFAPSRCVIRAEDVLYWTPPNSEDEGARKFGTVVEIDRVKGEVRIRKTNRTCDEHPPCVFEWDGVIPTDTLADSLCRLAEWVLAHDIDAPGKYRAARDLLLRRPPRLVRGRTLAQSAAETPDAACCRIVEALQNSTFAIQGPPGSGKTTTAAKMICGLLDEKSVVRRIGVTATGHKVIRHLLREVLDKAQELKLSVQCLHFNSRSKEQDGSKDENGVTLVKKEQRILDALASGAPTVIGGTAWLWAKGRKMDTGATDDKPKSRGTEYDLTDSLDVLFVDEAGQMSLANVLAVSQAAPNLVLLGDPQQLEQPLKGSHPPGADKSALEHLLGEKNKTMPADLGFLLPQTWRLHPNICGFTSKVFYEDKLSANEVTRARVLQGHPQISGAGLWFQPVQHTGNSNSSTEEVEAVARLVESLLRPKVRWTDRQGGEPLPLDRIHGDNKHGILIVAPYNAQVTDLAAEMGRRGWPRIPVGTVDKFQGQQAPVVIYSLTTSSPEDAPRGMEFLYSLNRLNVATSRAQSCVIVVGSPFLFKPNCRTPRQMKLANALCAYLEQAQIITP